MDKNLDPINQEDINKKNDEIEENNPSNQDVARDVEENLPEEEIPLAAPTEIPFDQPFANGENMAKSEETLQREENAPQAEEQVPPQQETAQPPKQATYYGNQHQYNKPPQQEGNPNNYTPNWGQPLKNNQDSYGGYQGSSPYQPPNYNTPSQYNTTTGFQNGNAPQEEPYKWNLNDYQQPPEKKPRKRKSNGLAVFAAIIAVLFAFCLIIFAGFGIYSFTAGEIINNSSTTPSAPESTPEGMPELSIQDKPEVANIKSADGRLSSVEISRKVKPSVVCIQNYRGNTLGATGEGSGIVMTADGYILTNAHVVEGSKGLKVILDNDEVYAATVIGADKQTDLAVIKIEAENLAYVDFGNSDQLEVGEKVLAIGNSAGMAGTVTQGIVSAINRNLTSENGYDMKFIQVDATINPGNSGGALVNEFGQVVGINSAKLVSEDVEGIGFAIPINEALPIIEDLMTQGRVTGRSKLGIEGIAIDSIDAKMYGVPIGVQIITIQPDSDLTGKNIVPGDIITKIDESTITGFEDIKAVLTLHKPGDNVKLTIYRPTNNNMPGKFFEISIKLVEDK